jgi:ABC-type transport system involved in multi-copper enzyme maturation permease subunit
MFSISTILVGMLLVFIQLLAMVPWFVSAFTRREVLSTNVFGVVKDMLTAPGGMRIFLYGVIGVVFFSGLTPIIFYALTRDPDAIQNWGRLYGAVLQIQLTVDFFVLIWPLLLSVWPKGGAVAQAAFREAIRQPMFWLLNLFAFLALLVFAFFPYFTFGEDYIMLKEIGFDTVMLTAIIFGVLAASMFVSDEIEGRTAVTLMSKPVSRRQFLLGKFAGILLACLLMFGLLGTHFEGCLLLKRYLEKMDALPLPGWVTSATDNNGLTDLSNDFLRGIGFWAGLTIDALPNFVLTFCQVMVLVSLAVALATRVPMIPNLTAVGLIFLASHITPLLVGTGRKAQEHNPGSIVAQMLSFVAQVFDTLLPGLDLLRVDPSLIGDVPPPAGPYSLYILSVVFYAVLYTLIVILFGLVLFEDRDLA